MGSPPQTSHCASVPLRVAGFVLVFGVPFFLVVRFSYWLGVEHGQQFERGGVTHSLNVSASDHGSQLSRKLHGDTSALAVVHEKERPELASLPLPAGVPKPVRNPGFQEAHAGQARVASQPQRDQVTPAANVRNPGPQEAPAGQARVASQPQRDQVTPAASVRNPGPQEAPAGQTRVAPQPQRDQVTPAATVRNPGPQEAHAGQTRVAPQPQRDQVTPAATVRNPGPQEARGGQTRVAPQPQRDQVTAAAIDKMSAENATKSSVPVNCKRFAETLEHAYLDQKPIGQFCRVGPFKSSIPSPQRRLAVLMRGESFRGLKGMFDRSIAVNKESSQCQETASQSQVTQIMEPFESCGFKVDVFLSAYKSRDTKKGNSSKLLVDFYGGRVVSSIFVDHSRWEKIGGRMQKNERTPQAVNFETGVQMIANHSRTSGITYDAILIIRFDIIIKENFLGPSMSNVPWQRVMFPFLEWLVRGGGGMVSDTIHWFPWRFANCLHLEGFREHYSGAVKDRVGAGNMGFLNKGFHDANSMADRNPLYRQCRPEQFYDILGGYVVIVFNVEVTNGKVFLDSGQGFGVAVFQQGRPRALPISVLTMSIWTSDPRHSRWLRNIMSQFPGVNDVPTMLNIMQFNQSYIAKERSSGWYSAWLTMTRGYLKGKNDPNYKESAARSHLYRLDRVVFFRGDYRTHKAFLDTYSCDTEKYVCIGMGARVFPEVPVVMVMSHKFAEKFAAFSTGDKLVELAKKGTPAARILETFFQSPIRFLCSTGRFLCNSNGPAT